MTCFRYHDILAKTPSRMIIITVIMNMKLIQYRPWALQHLHVCKLRAAWGINMQNTHTKCICEILCEQLHAA